jgi:hypothetical protein
MTKTGRQGPRKPVTTFATLRKMMSKQKVQVKKPTVAIYGRQDDMLHKTRTGVLFAVGQRYFILTAAQELEDYAQHGIPLYTAPTTPSGVPVPLGVTIRGNKALDIAIMELTDEIVGQLVPRRRFLRMSAD